MTLKGQEARRPEAFPEPAALLVQSSKPNFEVVADPEAGEAERHCPRDELEGEEQIARIDPLALSLSSPMPLLGAAAPEAGATSRALDPMVQEILQAVAWGGDKKRAAARLELGGRRYGGASVTVSVDGDSVMLQVSGPSHGDALALGERLQERLEQRGLRVTLHHS